MNYMHEIPKTPSEQNYIMMSPLATFGNLSEYQKLPDGIASVTGGSGVSPIRGT
jgi:hypothetical protein